MSVTFSKAGRDPAKQTRQVRGGNVGSAKKVTTVGDGGFSEIVANIMEPNHPQLLPRSVPTSAGVIFQKPLLPIVQDLSVEPYGALIVRADVEQTVTLFSGDSTSTMDLAATGGTGGRVLGYTDTFYCPIAMTNGTTYVPDVVSSPDLQYLTLDGESQPNKASVYRGVSAGTTSELRLSMYINDRDPASPVPITIRDVTGIDGEDFFSAPVFMSFNLVHNGNYWTSLQGVPTIAGRDLVFYGLSGGTDVTVITNFLTMKNMTIDSSSRREYSLWDLVGNVEGSDTIEGQYRAAQRYSITGLSALLRNTSAAAYKSGSVVAAQMPGGSEYLIPATPEGCYRFAASYNDPKTYQGQLNKGVHWFFSPEKLQDWFFESTRERFPNTKPYLIIAWTGVAVNDLANMLGLTLELRINLEILTTDISVMKFIPSADVMRLMDLYLTLVASHNPLGENPNHRDKIRKIISRISSDPAMRKLFEGMKSAGKTLIPLALSAGVALL